MSSSLPHILYAVPPREGHMRPALQIVAYLISHGFDITVPSTPNWRPAIESLGAHFTPQIGLWTELGHPSRWSRIVAAAPGRDRLAVSLDCGFVGMLPSGLESVRIALADMRRRASGCRIVVLSDTCFSGTLPLRLKADLPAGFEPDETIPSIGIGVVPPFWASPERPPWGWGLSLGEGQEERNILAHRIARNPEVEERARHVLWMLNCARPVDDLYADHPLPDGMQRPFWDAPTLCHDATLQMCVPSIEFVSSDWARDKIRFVGTLPIRALPENLAYPAWFDEVRHASEQGKKVVFVAQGTEVLDYRQLIIPTIEGLRDREDVLVVVVLCVRGAALDPASFEGGRIPKNVRVVDYFPYDAVLRHSDVFVSNSGYGGLQHAVANGVPMVQTGSDFDKPDIGRRVEWSGLGIFLPQPPPSPEEVRQAVTRILHESKFAARAAELQREAQACGPLEAVRREILKLDESRI